MSPKMNGKQESNPTNCEVDIVKERIRKIDELLDTYVSPLGIKYNQYLHIADIDRFLNLSMIEMNKMTSEDCAAAAYLLNQYAHHIQKEINRETAHINFARKQLEIEVARHDANYPGFKYEERCQHAIVSDNYLYKLSQVEVWAQIRIDRLAFLPSRLNKMADSLESLGRSKQYQHQR